MLYSTAGGPAAASGNLPEIIGAKKLPVPIYSCLTTLPFCLPLVPAKLIKEVSIEVHLDYFRRKELADEQAGEIKQEEYRSPIDM
jgi:hypothetical protein